MDIWGCVPLILVLHKTTQIINYHKVDFSIGETHIVSPWSNYLEKDWVEEICIPGDNGYQVTIEEQ